MMSQRYEFATYYRVLAMIFILLCHFVQESGNVNLAMTGQFFNVGVGMFIILSGFLFGVQSERGGQNSLLWIKKRLKRIYVPYELFVAVLLIVHYVAGRKDLLKDWMLLAIGLQGSVVGVLGAGQTWFVTVILVCYAITPSLAVLTRYANLQKVIIAVACLSPFCLGMIPEAWVSTLLYPVFVYGMAYVFGQNYRCFHESKKQVLWSVTIVCCMILVRLLAHVMCDGTFFYERIVTAYTQTVTAFALFCLIESIMKGRKSTKWVEKLETISFEVYLYHYMFCVGPIRLFGLTDVWFFDCIIVIGATLLLSAFMNYVGNCIVKKCFR